MKKIIVVLLAMIMVLGITACEKELDSSEMTALGRNLEGTWQISSGRDYYYTFAPGVFPRQGAVVYWGKSTQVNKYGNFETTEFEWFGSYEVQPNGKVVITYDKRDGDDVIYFGDENDKNTFSVEGGTDWVRIS